MNCSECQDRLLELAEGCLPERLEGEVFGHLATCGECRSELDAVQAGCRALTEVLPHIAPRRHYLTDARRQGLAHATVRRAGAKVISLRQFVAAVCAAAILAAAPFLFRDIRALLQPPGTAAQPAVAHAPQVEQQLPVVLTAAGQDEPVRVIRPFALPDGAFSAGRERPSPHLVKTTTPGLSVPVQNAFYDPEESSHWW